MYFKVLIDIPAHLNFLILIASAFAGLVINSWSISACVNPVFFKAGIKPVII